MKQTQIGGRFQRTHGGRDTPEYQVWANMKARSAGRTELDRKNYSGRGIKVCKRWSADFGAFFADIGKRPSSKHEIDRRDNNGNYSCGECDECLENGWPMNCRWVTRTEQMRNKRVNRLIIYKGETLPLTEWCERLGINASRTEGRLNRGWSVEEAFEVPFEMRGQMKGFAKLHCLQIPIIRILSKDGWGSRTIAKLLGVGRTTIMHILNGDSWSHVPTYGWARAADQTEVLVA